MSIASYNRNVERGVAGPDLPVCFPASLEQISPNHSYRPKVYTDYLDFLEYYEPLSEKAKASAEVMDEYEKIVEKIIRPLGKYALDNLIYRHINTEQGLVAHVNRLHDENYRVMVDIKYGNADASNQVHSLGLIPIEKDYVTLVSTHVPVNLRGVISLRQLAGRIAIVNDIRNRAHPIATANLLAIPHE